MAKMIADVSHWHPVSDWKKAKASCSFLIAKATEGTSYVDKTLDGFIHGCEANGIPYWLYTFLKNGNERKQAEFLASTCKGKIGKMFRGYVLDVESGNSAANVKAALDYLRSLGGKTMIYTGYSDHAKYKSVLDGRGSSCAWWEARYGKNSGAYEKSFPCHAGVDLHQYSSKGRVDGVSGLCDVNRLTGTKDLSWFTESSEKKEEIMGTTAQDIIKTMIGWIGKDRAKGTHKDIIDLYNSYKPLARNYKVKYTDEYCATTVSAAFIKNKAVDLIGGTECSVERFIAIFKKKGIWNEDGRITPKAGDIITYNWDDKTQPNDGWADHIGIVEKVSGGKITVIEGNISGKVGRRTIAVGAGTIRGYAQVKYTEGKTVKKETTKTTKKTTTTKTTKTSAPSKTVKKEGKVIAANGLNVRTWAGKENPLVKFTAALPKGTKVSICDTVKANDGSDWYYIKINGHYGFAKAEFIN